MEQNGIRTQLAVVGAIDTRWGRLVSVSAALRCVLKEAGAFV